MYPKIITIEDDKLKNLITQKSELVEAGRSISLEIEELEKVMDATDKEIQEKEKEVDIKDLLEKEKTITKKVEKAIEEMEGVKQEIYDRMIKEVPAELHKKYDDLKKDKKTYWEGVRNYQARNYRHYQFDLFQALVPIRSLVPTL